MADLKPVRARNVSRIAVLTGAGISSGLGIPDYRGPDGIWTRDPSAFTYDVSLLIASAAEVAD